MPVSYVVIRAKAISKRGWSLDGHANGEMAYSVGSYKLLESRLDVLYSSRVANQVYCLYWSVDSQHMPSGWRKTTIKVVVAVNCTLPPRET